MMKPRFMNTLGCGNAAYHTKGYLRWCKSLSIFLLIVVAASYIGTAQVTEKLNEPVSQKQVEYHGTEAAKVVPGAKMVLSGNQTTVPAFVRFKDGEGMSSGEITAWLTDTYNLGSNVGFELSKTQRDDLGYEILRYDQTYKGVAVDRGELIVQVKNGRVVSFSGNIYPLPDMPTSSTLSKEQAVKKAMDHVGATLYAWESEFWENDIKEHEGDPNATYYPAGELHWAQVRTSVKTARKQFKLAYELDMHTGDHTTSQRVYVDANTGEIINSYPIESDCDATTAPTIFNGNRTIRTDEFQADTWRLLDDCTGSNMRVRDWNTTNPSNPPANPLEITSGNNTNWGSTTNRQFGATVLWQCRESYDYFLAEHSIDSYDDADGDINGFIDAWFSTCTPVPPAVSCSTRNNASMSFTGGRMKVGMSSAGTLTNSYATLDIIGHEYAHAVTGASSNLTYQDESGALNESFSDIFGEAVERETLGSNDWMMGSERDNGRLRDLSNPPAAGDPDTYLGTNWAPTGAGQPDNGGVHTNSGVQNFWFYLLAVGGSGTNDNGNDYQVDGIGFNKAEDIAFRNDWIKLSAGSNYAAARTGAIDAAIDLYGDCSQEVESVMDAWYAVGVGSQFMDLIMNVTSDYNGRDVSCFGACDGAASVTVFGTNFPYTYQWTNTVPSLNVLPSVNGLCANTSYSVTVTDANGCTETNSVTLDEPNEVNPNPFYLVGYNGYDVSCFGASDGGVEVAVFGGTQPYTVEWSNGVTTLVNDGISAGTYDITATDINGCTGTDDITLIEPPLLTASAAATSDYNGYNVSCNGGSDGEATATGGGGVPPYSYDWDDANSQTTQVATGLMATTYTVTITDLNNCTADASTTLTEPEPLEIDAGDNYTVYFGYPDSACATLSYSGAAGGVPPYVIEWSTGETTTSIEVCPDSTTTYYVTITDANNCVLTDSAKVCVIDVRCGQQLKGIEICHAPPGNPSNTMTMCVGFNSVAIHLSHGDQLAACGTDKSCDFNGAKTSAFEWVDYKEFMVAAYPNPFSERLNITFTPDADTKVSLRVYNLTGQLIATLFEGDVLEGLEYKQELNTSTLGAGMYFYQLESDNGNTFTEKITLIR